MFQVLSARMFVELLDMKNISSTQVKVYFFPLVPFAFLEKLH